MLNKFRSSPYKLDCRQVESLVTAYLKGGLSPGQRHQFREHLLICDGCTRLVQEAREIDARLFESAHLEDRPYLTSEASLRIQERLYRRMRRALLFQRTRRATERIAAFAAVLFLVMASLVIGRPWLRFVATSQNEEVTPATVQLAADDSGLAKDNNSTPPADSPAATPRPREELVAAEPLLLDDEPETSNEPIIAKEPAEVVARTMIEAALQGDEAQLRFLLDRVKPLRPAGLRVWQRLEWCQGRFTADDLTLRAVTPHPRLTSIYIYQGNEFLGDLKFYLDDQGEWYLSYLNYGSFGQLSTGCIPE